MKFTIEELKLANELCFRDDFKRLLEKHLPEKEQDMVGFHCRAFNRMGNDLVTWIFRSSRADDRRTFWGKVNEQIVNDLLHNN